jgi:hypothetical protein
MSGSPRSLKCEGCQAENEWERVYCRACGGKLARGEAAGSGSGNAAVVPVSVNLPAGEAGGTGRFAGRVVGMPRGVFRFVQVVAAALVTGFLIQAFREPEFLEAQKGQLAIQPVGSAVLQALESPKPQKMDFSEADLNSYLGKIHSVKPSWIPGVKFGRFYVDVGEGFVCLQLRNDVWGWPLYMGLRYQVEGERGILNSRLVGASLGRARIPSFLAPGLRPGFGNLFRVMDAEWRLVSRMDSVRLKKGRLVLVTKGL